MFGLFGKKKDNGTKFKPVERAATTDNVNSLYDDAHVDPEAKPSYDALKDLREKAVSMKLTNMRLRGLKIENTMPDGQIFAKIEVNVMENENGIASFITLATEVRKKFNFTYVRLMGDVHENVGV